MNTTEKGDVFEGRAAKIIKDALDAGKLGIYANQCKVFAKKAYYSKDRESDIIFDLAIEVWPPGATNFTLLFLVECKNYSHRVPVNDVEEFHDKIRQVSGVNVKGIFITNNDFQEGAFRYARSKGMMLIQVDFNDTSEIILHRIQRGGIPGSKDLSQKFESWEEVLENFFEVIFDEHSCVTGIEQLSTEVIEDRAAQFREAMDKDSFKDGTRLPIDKLVAYLENNYGVKTDFQSSLGCDAYGNPILGYYDRDKQIIFIDRSVHNTERFLFTLCHEVGHVVLHRELKVNQKVYNRFKDSDYNFMLGKHELKNSKNWIEWQANQFSACLVLPAAALWVRVYAFQKANGIRNAGRIYYDNQPVNRKDFYDLTMFLSAFFCVSYTSIKYRLHETGILTYNEQKTGGHWTKYFSSEDPYIDDPRRRLRID